MAGSGEIRAGQAYVELFVKGDIGKTLDQTAKQLKEFGDKVVGIGKAMLIAGTAITAPLLIAAQQFASMGSTLNDVAARTGAGVEALQQFKYAADQTGASLEDVEVGLKKMAKAIFEAETGSKAAKQSLASIGLTIADLRGLSPEAQFRKIAAGLSSISDPSARAAVAMELLGKSGTKLIPMLADLNELTEHYQSLNATFSAEDIARADQFGDTLDDLTLQFRALVFHVGAAVAQAIQPFAHSLTQAMSQVIQFAKEHRSLIITVGTVAAGLITAGGAVVGLGFAIKGVGLAISGLTATFSFAASAIGLLLNPIVLVGAALVGLGAYFIYASDNGGKALDYLGAKFGELSKTATTAFGGIADALSAGDLALAAQIGWTGLKLAFLKGTQEIQAGWEDWKASVIGVAMDALFGVQKIAVNVNANLIAGWQKVTSVFGDLWDGVVGTMMEVWNTAISGVMKTVNWIREAWDSAFGDGSFSADAANKQLEDEIEARRQARAREEMEKKSARDKEKADALAAVEAERQQMIKALEDRKNAIKDGADENARQEVENIQKRKEELERQLQGMRKKAAEEKQQASGPEAPKWIDPRTQRDLDDVVGSRSSAKSMGTFSAFAVAGLQTAPVHDRIEKNTAKMATTLDRIERSRSGNRFK
jgi:hypothetical protein